MINKWCGVATEAERKTSVLGDFTHFFFNMVHEILQYQYRYDYFTSLYVHCENVSVSSTRSTTVLMRPSRHPPVPPPL